MRYEQVAINVYIAVLSVFKALGFRGPFFLSVPSKEHFRVAVMRYFHAIPEIQFRI